MEKPSSAHFFQQARELKQLIKTFERFPYTPTKIPRGPGWTRRKQFQWMKKQLQELNEQRRVTTQIAKHVAELCLLIGHLAQKYEKVEEILKG